MLQDRLTALSKVVQDDWDPDLLDGIDRALAELAASGQAERAVHAGQDAPRFRLPDQAGVLRSLDEMTRPGPLVLSFFRGAWCPFCTLMLESLVESVEIFAKLGASVAVISPENPAAVRAALPFAALLDHGGGVARKYGLEWTIPTELREALIAAGVDLAEKNSDRSWSLPIPARYVIDRAGMVVFAEVNPNFRQRPEPLELLPVLESLRERDLRGPD
jgi:peroxiredoxin